MYKQYHNVKKIQNSSPSRFVDIISLTYKRSPRRGLPANSLAMVMTNQTTITKVNTKIHK